ncbi:MAG: Mut7-C RNAse domain-containing protein [candidate division WOR-3 bacterium]
MGSGKGNNNEVKFGVDAMLGKVVRVLRFYGFDTEYYRDERDIEIVAKCLRDGRILITSDGDLVKLAKAWGLSVYFVENSERDKWDIVKGIIRDLKLKPKPFTRCPKCNGKLKMVSKWELEGFVHPFIWNRYDEFAVCEECGQIYWEGTHYDKILRNMGE